YGGGDASPPYEFLDETGQPQGVNVDLVRALARVAGRRIDIRLGKWDDIRKAGEAGEIDLISMAYTDERAGRYAFLDETWTVRLAVLFLGGRASYPTNLAGLGPERVAVQEGEMTHDLLLGLPEATRPVILTARDHAAAIGLLRSGRATAVAGNALVLRTALSRLGITDVHEVIVKAASYQLVTARGREAEMAWISPALQKLKESGEFSRIVERHLTEPPPLRSARAYGMLIASFFVAVGVLVTGGLAWNRSLRTQVLTRTRQIEEAAAEKERLARSLAEREQRMRVVVEQMPAILWSTDRDLRLTSAAGLGLKTFGIDAEKIIGLTAAPILEMLGLTHTGIMEGLQRGLQGQASDMEVQISGRDAEFHIEPLRDGQGEIVGLVGIAVDVADRRHAARALKESEERYRAFVEQSTEGIWRFELDAPFPAGADLDEQVRHLKEHAYVAECNDAMARLYGLSKAEELTGLSFREVRDLRHGVSNGDNIRDFAASGFKPTTWETHWVDKQGAPRWSVSNVVGVVKDGVLLRTWSTQQDITQRKLAEEGLRSALSVVRATLDSTTDGILVESQDGRIVDVNERLAEMWRMPEILLDPKTRTAQALGAHAMEQLDDPEGFLARIHEILSLPEGESYDVLRLKDGRVFERYSRPQRVDDAVVGRVWSFRDVTDRERSLRDIQEANRLLEVKNAELERFTYTVSHDLKSPLITIRGYLGHLETSATEGDLERFRADAARIQKATNKMEELLRDLLALSRVGRVRNPDEDVPLSSVAHDAAELVRGALVARAVSVEIAADLPVVRGDRQRVLEVFQNLFENATKFMGDQPAPKIEVGARSDSGEPVFFVRDNGLGIDPRHRNKVFDLFEKLTPGTEGTGVGLALVKRIIEAHGGRVWVESEGVGHGSTFCFTLPLAN
ncbi:MAG: transporter substrate-binding domain-containing protein, partial [Vicinamibacteria bacterium]|nr:transporter substrate-binding domain-containing protein [Vicinamibacteria bacterium]